MNKSNIVLIGMPGCGKSTIAKLLAKELGMKHIDGDAIMEEYEGMKLQKIIDTKGYDYVANLEGTVLKELKVENHVISPGGSCVYYEDGMQNLSDIGHVVYLKVDWSVLKYRCSNVEGRGILFKPGETLKDLYDYRTPMYERWGEIVIDSSMKTPLGTMDAIIAALDLKKK